MKKWEVSIIRSGKKEWEKVDNCESCEEIKPLNTDCLCEDCFNEVEDGD